MNNGRPNVIDFVSPYTFSKERAVGGSSMLDNPVQFDIE